MALANPRVLFIFVLRDATSFAQKSHSPRPDTTIKTKAEVTSCFTKPLRLFLQPGVGLPARLSTGPAATQHNFEHNFEGLNPSSASTIAGLQQ